MQSVASRGARTARLVVVEAVRAQAVRVDGVLRVAPRDDELLVAVVQRQRGALERDGGVVTGAVHGVATEIRCCLRYHRVRHPKALCAVSVGQRSCMNEEGARSAWRGVGLEGLGNLPVFHVAPFTSVTTR